MTKIKKAWDDYGGLIMAVGGVVSIICSAAIYVGSLMLDTRIKEIAKEVVLEQTGTNIALQVGLNTDAVEDFSEDIKELTRSVNTLNTDVKDTLRILAAK